MATANPAMNDAVYFRAGHVETQADAMTLQGTVLKTGILVGILLVTAIFSAAQFAGQPDGLAIGLLIGGVIGGLITCLITIFSPKASPITAPLYAAFEGLVMGAITIEAEKVYRGIAGQALGLTVGVLAVMLFIYGTGMIRATEKFKIGIVAATGAIFLVYLASMVVSLFNSRGLPFIHDAGPIGIIFSLVVVVIAALNLILDFDFIEQGVRRQAPKYLEWYGGFSLLVTLIWMYVEILRLLSKLRQN